MIRLIRTSAKSPDFVLLVKELDTYLKITDGDEHDFYNQYNGLDNLTHCVVVYQNKLAVGCGAFKKFDNKTIEIKRMYVKPLHRIKGMATKIIQELLLVTNGARKDSNLKCYANNAVEKGKLPWEVTILKLDR